MRLGQILDEHFIMIMLAILTALSIRLFQYPGRFLGTVVSHTSNIIAISNLFNKGFFECSINENTNMATTLDYMYIQSIHKKHLDIREEFFSHPLSFDLLILLPLLSVHCY